ncbi:hypothetical protein SLEP1_g34846 [Rubroshorea leprosula]|uniref:Uncharacterized protein n=1 Tax=Rubroshorea leprosula TaxID=152421 RepID=A0AAV5KLA0_9ROSI|nr:hypothetical protein SLEP1_g34846 [Rubroshorea leprosula]
MRERGGHVEAIIDWKSIVSKIDLKRDGNCRSGEREEEARRSKAMDEVQQGWEVESHGIG